MYGTLKGGCPITAYLPNPATLPKYDVEVLEKLPEWFKKWPKKWRTEIDYLWKQWEKSKEKLPVLLNTNDLQIHKIHRSRWLWYKIGNDNWTGFVFERRGATIIAISDNGQKEVHKITLRNNEEWRSYESRCAKIRYNSLKKKFAKKRKLTAFVVKIEERVSDWKKSQSMPSASYLNEIVWNYICAFKISAKQAKLARKLTNLLVKAEKLVFSSSHGT